jgi:hypothetical protein
LGTIYSYLVFKGLSTTGQGLMNNNILAPKIRELQIDPQNKQSLPEEANSFD